MNILKDMRKNKRFFHILTVTFLIISFFVASYFISANFITNRLVKILQQSAGENCYHVMDNISYERDAELFSTNFYSGLKCLKIFNNLLETPSEDYLYSSVIDQPIYIDQNLGEEFLEGYSSRPSELLEQKVYRSVQMNLNAMNKTGLQVAQGRIFKEEDFMFKEGNKLPVIIGSDLNKFYSVGDTFELKYLYKDFTGYVIGVLPPQALLPQYGTVLNLDRTFVLPSLCFSDDTTEPEFQQMLYHQKNSGVFYTQLTTLEMQEKIDQMINEAGLKNGDYALDGVSLLHFDTLGLGIAQTQQLIYNLVTLIYLVSVLLMMLCTYLKVHSMLRTFSIHLICGASKKKLIAALFLESFIWVFLAFSLSSVLVYFIFQMWEQVGLISLLALASILLIPLPASIKIIRMRIPENIRRSR